MGETETGQWDEDMAKNPEYGEAGDESDESVEPAGKFRIYLGAVAGVGKTYAMLNEAGAATSGAPTWSSALSRAMAGPTRPSRYAICLVVPRKVCEYRGTTFEEMDLDAVLARKPEVALVDELAHTNVPGSGPHAKRWEDVLELLDAGIDVITTVNIQHLESVADAVEQMTGVPVRERVPDWVVRRADQTRAGRLVARAAAPAHAARQHLPAREGPRCPHQLLPLPTTSSPCASWRCVSSPTRPRRSSCATSSPGTPTSSGTLPSASWWPSQAPREQTQCCAAPPASPCGRTRAWPPSTSSVTTAPSTRPRSRLAKIKHLAEDLGATWHEITADDPAPALVQFAKDHQITQIVLGASRRSRWEQVTSRASVVQRVLRFARQAGVDVHVIARWGEGAPLSALAAPEDSGE